MYSCVHISSDEVFSKILKKQSIVQKTMIPHMKAFGLFNKMKQKKLFFFKKKFQKFCFLFKIFQKNLSFYLCSFRNDCSLIF